MLKIRIRIVFELSQSKYEDGYVGWRWKGTKTFPILKLRCIRLNTWNALRSLSAFLFACRNAEISETKGTVFPRTSTIVDQSGDMKVLQTNIFLLVEPKSEQKTAFSLPSEEIICDAFWWLKLRILSGLLNFLSEVALWISNFIEKLKKNTILFEKSVSMGTFYSFL